MKRGWWVLGALGLLALMWWAGSRLGPRATFGCTGAPMPTFAQPRELPNTLRGARVMLNPGHGFVQTDQGIWAFQRPQPDGVSVFVLEDDSNLRLARVVAQELEAAGAVVMSTRAFSTNLGTSKLPAWREATRHHLERLGVVAGIWDSAGWGLRGDCNLGKDIRARALYANLEQADVLLSLHSNAGSPQTRGTQIFYPTRHFLSAAKPALQKQSECLAQALALELPKQIRQERPWNDATISGSSQYGENGFALMPSVILEVGFHTNHLDGEALQSASFRQAVARGVRSGLERFLITQTC